MFAKRLKILREHAKINQSELARSLDVTQGTIGNWETGKRIPDSDTLKVIANYFGVSIDYLLGNDNREDANAHFDDPKIRLLARHLAEIKDDYRRRLIDNIEGTIKIYQSAKGDI